MLAEIITIGDEILIGQIVDTNSAFISKELNKIGVQVYQITSVQDNREHILEALNDAKSRVDLILVTGGLGPTKDDITKQCFCEFLDDHLVENQPTRKQVEHLFRHYFKKEPTALNYAQAMVPSKAHVFVNQHGTAPGMWMEKEGKVFVSMPGVPYEMKRLLTEQVLPKVVTHFHTPFIYHKTLLTYGMGESAIAERLDAWEDALPKHIKLAYLPNLGRVRLRLSSKGVDEVKLHEEVDAKMEELQVLLKDIAIGFEETTNVVLQIGALLEKANQTLSVVESCTGGSIAEEITRNAGVSNFFRGGLVPYATELKTSILGVDADLIKERTVVSLPVAEAMAERANVLFQTNYAIATTGIAGPTKGDGEDEVGTVCIAIAGPNGTISEKFLFGKARERVIGKSVNKAFEMLLKEISKN